jgi:glycosyltransferase involved in cell wall biosynthesis
MKAHTPTQQEAQLILRFVTFCYKIKPFIKRIVPKTVIAKMKERMLGSAFEHITSGGTIPFDRKAYPDGINLTGNVRGQTGLGQSCRLLASAIKAGGMDFTLCNQEFGSVANDDHMWDADISDTYPYNINILHFNPPEYAIVCESMGAENRNRRYNIAYWLWETETIPDIWRTSIDLSDEIWAPSAFISDAVRRVTDKPIFTIPYGIDAPTDPALDRKHFGVPEDKCLFLCMYESGSVMERKNPAGAIRAFRQAFTDDPDHGAWLVVKVNNPTPKDIRNIRREAGGLPCLTLITDMLSKTEVNSLINVCDVFISLHRAEGFGLVPAEAMYLGKPVIATNWSSNIEFMNAEVACMVEYALIEIDHDVGPYKKGTRWADPDVSNAARYINRLYSDPALRATLGGKAAAHIRDKRNLERAARLIAERIAEIYSST